MEKTINWNGINWKLSWLSDDAWSLLCLEPSVGDDDVDYTAWPDNSLVSEWAGQDLVFHDAGDHPEYPEGIFFAPGNDDED